ncbi:hypothetical protein ACFVAQ_45085 [Streptomyces sp. NPDC057651]|uniref:hypothetical protein n=1 Tax=Streptomyces sp. NPDC057651 TaxID=3346194 RepID=UPI0036B0D58E
MLLRRYHDTDTEPDDVEPDTTEPDDTAPDTTKDAPQAKPAGRSPRKKGDA